MTLPARSHSQRLVEVQTGRDLEVTLRELYVDSGHSQEAIARALGVSRATVGAWLRDFRIRRPERPAIVIRQEGIR